MLKKINKKLFLIILGSIFAGIVITVIANQGASATSNDSFCLSCHDVPEFKENFEVTPHSQVGCISCHGDGFVKDKVKGTTKFFKTLTNQLDPNDYQAIKADVGNDKCLSCHNMDNLSRDQNTVALHEDFVTGESDTTCATCHNVKFFHGDLEGSSKGTAEEATEEDESAADSGTVEVSADGLYSDRCANCHGGDLQGAVYANPISGLPYKDLLEKLQDGHGGIDDEGNAKTLAEWISEQSAEEATEEDESAADSGTVEVSADGLYSDRCANCHGGDLQGAVYANPISGLPYKDLLEKLQDGHGGVDDEGNAKTLAEWISEQ